MIHIYDVEVARKVGIKEAVLLCNFEYWIEKNRANEVHLYDGKYWTYNSIRAYTELFPEMSVQNIRTALKHLEDGGYIETGNFNKANYDRTIWYTLTDKYYTLKGENQQMHLLELTNGIVNTNKPIPNINTNKETNNIKHQHGDNKNVLLTDKEYESLVERFGKTDAENKINNLSYYLASTGKKYKSHYMTILNWARKETPSEQKNGKYVPEPPKYKKFEKDELDGVKGVGMPEEMRERLKNLF